MKRIAIIAALWPSLALAQQSPPMSASASLTGQMASLLAQTLDERDTAREQIKALSAELDKLRAANKVSEAKP